jgi:hypothetical protein
VPVGQADPYLIAQIQSLLKQCIEMARPCAAYTLVPEPKFEIQAGQMHVAGKVFYLERMVWSALKKSSQIAFFISTCGPEVEFLSKQLMKEGHSLEALIVDLVGSEIAEYTADFVHRKIENDVAALGYKITNRYSPGYCNWPVTDQQKLFELMKPRICGVNLTPSSLMIPIKSVSGIVGIGEQAQFRTYACARCKVDQCLYRDKRAS